MSATSHPSVRAIAAAVRANVPVLIEGMPGEAKSASISSWAESWGLHDEVITGSSRDKGDFMGMPLEVDGEVVYSPPSWVKRLQQHPKSLLVIDEFTTAGEAYKLMLRIVQERVVGEAQLPETCSIIAIANPVEVAVDGTDLPAPNANRFMHVTWHFDFDSWAHGLLTDFQQVQNPRLDAMLIDEDIVPARWAKVVGSVLAFLQKTPKHRSSCPTDPEAGAKAWPSPRSWTNAAKVISHLDEDDAEAIVLALKGCVGEGPTREYLSWLANADLHDPREVMNDPSIVDWRNERPDRLFALVNSVLATTMIDERSDTWRQAMVVMVACANGGKPDAATPAARTLLSRMPEDVKMPQGTRQAFRGLLEKMPDAMRV